MFIKSVDFSFKYIKKIIGEYKRKKGVNMSYQFIHHEDYSITKSKKKTKREEDRIKKEKALGIYKENQAYDGSYNSESEGNNLRSIIAEAKREPGNIPSTVISVADPILIYGTDLDTLENIALNYYEKTKLKDKNGKEKKLRKDANIILAGVISLNRENEELWEDYKNDSIQFLKEKYGDRLKTIVEHIDEEHPHFHFYVVPDVGEFFDLVHDGKRAAMKVRALNKPKGEQNTAYIKAMTAYQEDFFLKVASKYGLTKDGPKRARIGRDDYLKQKQEIKLLNKLRKQTETELFLLKQKTEKEIKDLKQKSEDDIKKAKDEASALGRRIGRSEGFKSAIIDFKGKNVFSKAVFSKTFSDDMIRKLKNENELLRDKNKRMFKRKEHYKKDALYKNKYHEEEKKNSYLKNINDFIENINEIENKRENEDDIRRNIISEINRVETQQQQINSRSEIIRQRNIRTRGDFKTIKARIGRTVRLLFNNIKATFRDFITNKLLEKRSEKPEEIKTTIETIKKENEIKIKKDPGINRKGEEFKI